MRSTNLRTGKGTKNNEMKPTAIIAVDAVDSFDVGHLGLRPGFYGLVIGATVAALLAGADGAAKEQLIPLRLIQIPRTK
jgi:hypothetical protein